MDLGIHRSIIDGVSSPWMNRLENVIGLIATFSIQKAARFSYLADSTTNHLDAGYWRSSLDLKSQDTALCSITHGYYDSGRRSMGNFRAADIEGVTGCAFAARTLSPGNRRFLCVGLGIKERQG